MLPLIKQHWHWFFFVVSLSTAPWSCLPIETRSLATRKCHSFLVQLARQHLICCNYEHPALHNADRRTVSWSAIGFVSETDIPILKTGGRWPPVDLPFLRHQHVPRIALWQWKHSELRQAHASSAHKSIRHTHTHTRNSDIFTCTYLSWNINIIIIFFCIASPSRHGRRHICGDITVHFFSITTRWRWCTVVLWLLAPTS